jgi:hypothetical protein
VAQNDDEFILKALEVPVDVSEMTPTEDPKHFKAIAHTCLV